MAKNCTLSASKFPPGSLTGNVMVRINDRADMTSAVYHGRKALNQRNKTLSCSLFVMHNQ